MSPPISYRGQFARSVLRQHIAREIELSKLQASTSLDSIPDFVGDAPGGPHKIDPYDLPHDTTQVPPNLGFGDGDADEAPDLEPPVWPELNLCIVGAGVAGLYVAMILDSLEIPNLKYDILESSDRIGGRLYTHNFDPATPHLYYDIGAMRYPRIKTMDRTFDLFERVGIKGKEIKYFMDDKDGVVNNPSYLNDILHIDNVPGQKNVSDVQPDYFCISKSNGGSVPDEHVAMGVEAILEKVFGEYKQGLQKDWKTGFEALMEQDKYSTRGYLQAKTDFGDFPTIQWLETMNSSSGLYDQAFSESVIDSFDFDFPNDITGDRWVCLEGGSNQIALAMADKIAVKPLLQSRVTSIAIDRSKQDPAMTVKYVSQGHEITGTYATVFNSASLACCHRMDLSGAELHPTQKDALRALRYDAATKVAIVFATPWWIVKGIKNGGVASTDRPIRTCVYPSYNLNDDPTKPAVLLCSYSWAQDAQRVGGLIHSKQGEEELKELVLNDLASLHSNIITRVEIEEQFQKMHAFDWYANPNTSGAFALFGPGQFSQLYPVLSRPTADGNLHFVGEATSGHHAWVVGELESAWRAVFHFLKKRQMVDGFMRPHWQERIQRLRFEWGLIDEVDIEVDGTAHLQVFFGQLKPEDQIEVVHSFQGDK